MAIEKSQFGTNPLMNNTQTGFNMGGARNTKARFYNGMGQTSPTGSMMNDTQTRFMHQGGAKAKNSGNGVFQNNFIIASQSPSGAMARSFYAKKNSSGASPGVERGGVHKRGGMLLENIQK